MEIKKRSIYCKYVSIFYFRPNEEIRKKSNFKL